jgi:phospholipase/lecithinase/hemolysin
LTDIVDPAQGMTGANPDQFLFWDDQHATTAADSLIADLALADIRATPEPASFALTGAAFLATAVILKRRSRTR